MERTADMGWGSDAYPGEEPETQAVNEQAQPRRDYTERTHPDPATYHHWVFISGHIVMDSDRDAQQLVQDHGHTNLDKPLAYGRVAVQHRWTAHFQIDHTNISPYLVISALKKYAKEQGWNDLAFVDHNGEELAPPKLANDVGTGWNTALPDWRNTDQNPNSDIQRGEFHENPSPDGPETGIYDCPSCSQSFDNYQDFERHLADEKEPVVDGVDETLPNPDDVMPGGWNNSTSPDWVRIMSKTAGRFQITNAEGDVVNDSAPDAWHCIEWAKDMARTSDLDNFSSFLAYDSETGEELGFFKPDPEDVGQPRATSVPPHMSSWDHPEPVPAEPGTTPIPPGHMRLYHYTDSYPNFESIKQQGIKNSVGKGESYGEPSQIWASNRKPEDHKAYFEFSIPSDDPRLDIGKFFPYTNDKTGEKHTPETWAEYMAAKGSDVTLPYGDIAPEEIIAAHEPWHRHYRYLQGTKDQYPEDYENSLSSDWTGVPDVKEAVDRINMERARTSAAPKINLPGPIPFIFDIEQDRVFVGHPGETTGDVKAGDFNPLGIVEGDYLPNGMVQIRTQTNMPYTIRHMIQLWYYLHPELEVKGVDIEYADGSSQKLASFSHRHSMALRQHDLDAWIKEHGPYAVHWTSPEVADKIMREGIQPWQFAYNTEPDSMDDDEYEQYLQDQKDFPDAPRANWGGGATTRPGHVYMADPTNTDILGMTNDTGSSPFKHPIHIDLRQLDPNKFKADEDWAGPNWPKLRPDDVDEDEWEMDGPPRSHDDISLGDWADQQGLDDPDWTHKSLIGEPAAGYGGGTLAYEGTIPPEALRHFPDFRGGARGMGREYYDFMKGWHDEQGQPEVFRNQMEQAYAKVAAAPDDVGEKIRNLLKQDPSAVEVYNALSPLGNVYVVGGAIRDLALGLIPKDIDIMAQGIEPDDVIKALKTRPGHVEVTGNQFPVIRYFHPSGEQCEVALPRREVSTGGGGKHDFEVQMDINMPVEEDLERRDFTGNSMAVDLKTGKLIDPYGGWEDLEQGKLSMVHPNAFKDDATRILRGLSSKSRHGLHPDAETQAAMSEWSHRIDTHVPNEMKAAELEKLMKGNDPASAIQLAQDTGVLKHVLPELAETHGFDQKSKYHNKLLFDHIVEVLRRTAEVNNDPDVRMAAALHDIGKPGSQWFDDDGYGHYYEKHFKPDEVTGERRPSVGKDHEHHGADLARDRLKELTWGNSDRQKRVEHLVRSHMFDPFTDQKGARKFLNKYDPDDEGHANDLMDIRWADSGQKANPWDGDVDAHRDLIKQVREQGEATNLKGLALNGNDVMQILQIKGGPEVGQHLQRLQEIVLEEPALNTREDLTQALMMKQANILDPVQDRLDPDVFDNAEKAKPKLKPHISEWVRHKVDEILRTDWAEVIPHTKLVMTGSLTSYQWSHKSDFDVSVWFDYNQFPNLVRAEMISLMVTELDGTLVPGTTHELQCYIVPNGIEASELYKPGLRSAYDLDKNRWIVAPERDRIYNPYTEVPALMGTIHDWAEKLKLLQNFDPPGAEEYLRQIHERRRRDQAAGKGDFTESNVLWKYLEHMDLV